MNKKMLIAVVTVFLLVLGITVLLFIWLSYKGGSDSLPFNITVTFGRDVGQDKNFCWFTHENTEGYIQYMEETADGFDVSASTEIKASSEQIKRKYPESNMSGQTPVLSDKTYWRHRAYITGLKPGTRYLYRVGAGGDFSDVYSFKTADDNNHFDFVIVADSQGFVRRDFECYAKVLDKSAEMYPGVDFYVHLGDFVEDRVNELQWIYVLNLPRKIMANHTFVPVAGNKDEKDIYEHFTLGSAYDTSAMVNGWFSFDYNNVHFTVLYTGSSGGITKKQISWLKEDLEKHADKRTIVLTHKAPYTNANHADDKEIVKLREELLPVFDAYGVDVVLQGHDHYFFRSEPIFDGRKGSYEINKVNDGGDTIDMLSLVSGTVYLINSSAGIKQYNKTFRNMDNIYAVKSFNCKHPTFSYCSVTENSILFKTYEFNTASGKVNLIDAFGVSS